MKQSSEPVSDLELRDTHYLNYCRTPLTLLAVLVISSGLSCAVTPGAGPSADAPTATSAVAGANVASAFAAYQQRDFGAAAAGFDAVAADSSASQNDQRLAHLGKAMVNLSTDPEYRDVKEAGMHLQAAEAIKGDSTAVETGMLMNAMSALVGVESNVMELNTKVANSSREIATLKAERDTLKAGQETLTAENADLNQALEKLKALTLGN